MSMSKSSSKPAIDVVAVRERNICCEGGEATGHPSVFYYIGEANEVVCIYCNRKFVYQADGENL